MKVILIRVLFTNFSVCRFTK